MSDPGMINNIQLVATGAAARALAAAAGCDLRAVTVRAWPVDDDIWHAEARVDGRTAAIVLTPQPTRGEALARLVEHAADPREPREVTPPMMTPAQSLARRVMQLGPAEGLDAIERGLMGLSVMTDDEDLADDLRGLAATVDHVATQRGLR